MDTQDGENKSAKPIVLELSVPELSLLDDVLTLATFDLPADADRGPYLKLGKRLSALLDPHRVFFKP